MQSTESSMEFSIEFSVDKRSRGDEFSNEIQVQNFLNLLEKFDKPD